MITALTVLKDRFPTALRLDTTELAAALRLHRQSILNQVSAKTFPIHTYMDGRFRYADIRDVAEYMDKVRNKRTVGRPTKASLIESQK